MSIDVDDISLKGIHNISNIIIAAEIARRVGIDNENMPNGIYNVYGQRYHPYGNPYDF